MNDNVLEWAKALNSLSVEYIVENSLPSDMKYIPSSNFRTHIGNVVVHLDGRVFRLRHTFDLKTLDWDEDDALFDMLDITNFEEAVRILTL